MHATSAIMAFSTALSSVSNIVTQANAGTLTFSKGLASVASAAMSSVMIIS
jgi:hypothetical protein